MRWSPGALAELGGRVFPLPGASPPAAPGAGPALFSLGCFECRLGGGSGVVDFSACVAAEGAPRRALHERISRDVRAGRWPAGAGWARCRDLLLDWSREGSPLFRASNCLWLEFDLGPDAPDPPQPFAVVRMRHPRELPSGAPFDPVETAARCAELLLGAPLRGPLRALLRRCQGELPPSGRFLHVAAMPLRAGSPVRLILSMPLAAVPGFADRVGWPGGTRERRDLERLCARLAPFPVRTSLHLDLADGVGPALGLDLYRPGSPREDPAWKVLFDALEAQGACLPQERLALAAWPPRRSEREAARPFGLDRELATKIVVGGREVGAKAYLAFAPRLGGRPATSSAA